MADYLRRGTFRISGKQYATICDEDSLVSGEARAGYLGVDEYAEVVPGDHVWVSYGVECRSVGIINRHAPTETCWVDGREVSRYPWPAGITAPHLANRVEYMHQPANVGCAVLHIESNSGRQAVDYFVASQQGGSEDVIYFPPRRQSGLLPRTPEVRPGWLALGPNIDSQIEADDQKKCYGEILFTVTIFKY